MLFRSGAISLTVSVSAVGLELVLDGTPVSTRGPPPCAVTVFALLLVLLSVLLLLLILLVL